MLATAERATAERATAERSAARARRLTRARPAAARQVETYGGAAVPAVTLRTQAGPLRARRDVAPGRGYLELIQASRPGLRAGPGACGGGGHARWSGNRDFPDPVDPARLSPGPARPPSSPSEREREVRWALRPEQLPPPARQGGGDLGRL